MIGFSRYNRHYVIIFIRYLIFNIIIIIILKKIDVKPTIFHINIIASIRHFIINNHNKYIGEQNFSITKVNYIHSAQKWS